jgi:hypothetical protein
LIFEYNKKINQLKCRGLWLSFKRSIKLFNDHIKVMICNFYISKLAKVNLKVFAGVAKPSPKMGQALGPLGINMMQFCKVCLSIRDN